MFKTFLDALMAPEPDPLDDGDARLALTALLVRVARTDGHYAPDEIERIDRIVEARFGLGVDAAKDLRRDAEVLESEAPDTVRFTRAIKSAVPHDARIGVVEALWQVVLADGVRDHEEDALLRMVSNLLGVTDLESAQARQRVSRA